ncbi:hypothetical protein WJX75_004982 [Coccomyxa subellipsoidea]|uniref:Uncharacterized protein n=1 Tax=Coccomyxa subellipsoidea TaxID=248742 RepID=A0ABR2Z2Z7_9CHLO
MVMQSTQTSLDMEESPEDVNVASPYHTSQGCCLKGVAARRGFADPRLIQGRSVGGCVRSPSLFYLLAQVEFSTTSCRGAARAS